MAEPALEQRFAEAMGDLLGPDFPGEVGLAVSGGGDSMAMLALAHGWARVWGVRLWIVTIDHGLRPDSAAEAAMVAGEAQALGHPHATLRWRWDGQGNLQARARDARLALIDRWRGRLRHVLFAHTRDDIAETFLLRLARQSGVEGLAAMQRSRHVVIAPSRAVMPESRDGCCPPGAETTGPATGFWVHRPCLSLSRTDLRHYARTLHVPWAEDPSNADPRFDRARIRAALPQLGALGIDPEALVSAAHHMARAADALRRRAASRFAEIGREGSVAGVPTGEILFDRSGFEATERDTQMRLLSYALSYVSSQGYRPRERALEAVLDRVLGGGGRTLHGCEARMERDRLRVFREYAAVAEARLGVAPAPVPALWDNRFEIETRTGQVVRALGKDGWAQIGGRCAPTASADHPPFHAARSLPSVWQDDSLVACPGLGFGAARVALRPMGRRDLSFAGFCLSH